MRLARALPSSTPHWSKLLIPQRHALDEGLVLVEGDQGAQRSGRQAVQQDEGGGAVAGEGALGRKGGDGRLGEALGARARRGPRPRRGRPSAPRPGRGRWPAASPGQPGGPSSVATTATKSTGTTSVPWCSSWKKACWTLVPARRTPPRRWRAARARPRRVTCLPFDSISSCCRNAGSRRRRWRRAPRRGRPAQAVAVEHVRQGQQHRGVALERRGQEVGVHRRAARQQPLEHLRAQADGAGEAHRRPQRIAPADPVPEGEHAVGANAERGRAPRALAETATRCWSPAGPSAARSQSRAAFGVGHGLLGGEGLGDHDHQGLGGIEAGQRRGDLRPSTLAAKRSSIAARAGFSASQTSRGPRSEPPMPMWTTVGTAGRSRRRSRRSGPRRRRPASAPAPPPPRRRPARPWPRSRRRAPRAAPCAGRRGLRSC